MSERKNDISNKYFYDVIEGKFTELKSKGMDEKEISEIPSNAQLVENIELHVPTLDAKRQAVIIKLQNS